MFRIIIVAEKDWTQNSLKKMLFSVTSMLPAFCTKQNNKNTSNNHTTKSENTSIHLLRNCQQLYKRQQREQGSCAGDVILELCVRLVAVLTLLRAPLEPQGDAVHAFGVSTGSNSKIWFKEVFFTFFPLQGLTHNRRREKQREKGQARSKREAVQYCLCWFMRV